MFFRGKGPYEQAPQFIPHFETRFGIEYPMKNKKMDYDKKFATVNYVIYLKI